MGKLDRIIAANQLKRPQGRALQGRAEELLASLRDEIESARPDLSSQLGPAFEQVRDAQRELAHLLGVVFRELSSSLDRLNAVDKIGDQVEDFIEKNLKARFDPFSERVIEILKAARPEAQEGAEIEAEAWRFKVLRDADGRIEEVIATKQTDLDERLETIDELVAH